MFQMFPVSPYPVLISGPLCDVQRLLQHPELSNSQLLADFLSPHSVESQFLDRMLPDVNLGASTSHVCPLIGKLTRFSIIFTLTSM